MNVQRTITIIIADDPDLLSTLTGFQGIQQRISEACYNDGKPLSALNLHRAVYERVTNAAERRGLLVDAVNPAYTSQDCSRCGLRGVRKRHAFRCPHCGHETHADVNAATNIRQRFTAYRMVGNASSSRSPM